MTIVPLFRYFVFVGLALAGLLIAVEAMMTGSNTVAQASSGAPAIASASSRSSIDLLRKMSHHGEMTSTALAASGPMLPVPMSPVAVAPRDLTPVAAETHAVENPTVAAAPPATLNAQARLAADEVVATKPVKKKVAARKPHAYRYVENTQRGPFDFFGSVESW